MSLDKICVLTLFRVGCFCQTKVFLFLITDVSVKTMNLKKPDLFV